MVKSGIKIYARLKPTKKPVGLYEIEEFEDGPSKLSFTVPKSESSGFVNNKKEIYNFQFNEVFDQRTRQDKVFEAVAQGVVDNCLDGYNGTIFAYGQTGSGKTFTITGGVEKFADRGIIPRTLSYLFQKYSKSPSTIFSTHVSYMEIYNESCYDLLDPEHETSSLEDLPKVILMEGEDGNIHLKNLSMHLAANEEEALNWLFVGDTNRMIAETPMNMASTRSHCIFTIHISSREPGSDTIRKSKLHLVDLAGSERVGKTGVGGALLTEAKYINLSLHFLEQVIVALSEKSRTHIPYRNSMMTSVLRDSLGGNCMTTMIATCAVEKRNIDETISTCRFAQRVAMVKNDALVNEELDPKLMVAHLKQRVQELKDELTLATGEERTDELTEEEKERCVELVQAYIQDVSPEAKLMLGGDMRKISHCFALLKDEILKRNKEPSPDEKSEPVDPSKKSGGDAEFEKPLPSAPPTSEDDEKATPSSSAPLKLELEMLQARLRQRDSEIRILLRMMKQERKRADRAEASLGAAGGRIAPVSPVSPDRLSPMRLARSVEGSATPTSMAEGSNIGGGATQPGSIEESNKEEGSLRGTEVAEGSGRQVIEGRGEGRTQGGGGGGRGGGGGGGGVSTSVSTSSSDSEWKTALKAELSRARQEAFDNFRKSVADTTALDQHKKILKIKYSEAKALGEKVNTTRLHINKLKSRIEKHRIARGIQAPSEAAADQREEELVKELETQKAEFKQLYDNLRRMKTEIEHVQHLLQKCKVQIQRDFEEWWKKSQAPPTTRVLSPRAAWHTPPPHLSGPAPHSRQSDAPPLHQSNSTPYSHAPAPHQSDSTHHSQERAYVVSPPNSQRLRRHQEAIAAQYSDRQPLPLSSSFGYENGTKVEQGGGGPKRSNQGSLYPSSWQQEDSISGSHSSESARKRLEEKGVSRDGKTEEDYLSKKKHLFPSDTDHRHSFRSSSQDKDGSLVLKDSKSPLGTQPSIPLTGDTKADADIIAFYKARQKLISKGLR